MPSPFAGPLAAAFSAPPGRALAPARVAALLVHPDVALGVRPARDRAVWDLDAGSADRATLHSVLARAHDDLARPWPLPLASTTARLRRDGNRTDHEALVLARQQRLSRAVLAAAATLEDRWVDQVADGVWALCEQSSWCWPAHDDAHAERGWFLPDVDRPYLDLGAGEVAGQLAWTDHLLGDALDARYPGLRARVRTEVRRRVVDPFVERRDWHWIGLDGDVHNWNPWIHGNVLVAALRLLDAPAEADLRARVVALAVEGLDRYVATLPDDGATDEGYAYWWNGACRAIEALDTLATATGGALDALAGDGAVASLRATVGFPHRMHLGGDWYLNVADGQARPPRAQPWHALHAAARRVGDGAARRHAASYRVPGEPVADEAEGLGRLVRAVTDGAWVAQTPTDPPLPRDAWLGSIQVLVARERAGSPAGLTLAAKGGHNGEHHNHDDVGSFVVASDGVPVLVDAGRPTYTAQTFGPDRYALWMMQSSWHNVPEVAGSAQGTGAQFAARDVRVDGLSPAAEGAGPAPGRTGIALELAGAYPVPVSTWRRDVRLERGARRVVVDDAWRLDPATEHHRPGTSVRLLVAGQVELGTGHALVHPLDGATPVRVSWPADVPATVVPRPLGDPLLSEVWGPSLTRIDLDGDARTTLRVVVEQLPAPAAGTTLPDPGSTTNPEETTS